MSTPDSELGGGRSELIGRGELARQQRQRRELSRQSGLAEEDIEFEVGPGGQARPTEGTRREVIRRRVAGQFEDFAPEDVVVSGGQARISEEAQRRELREDVLEQAGEGFTEEDVEFERTDGELTARVSEDAQRRELRRRAAAGEEVVSPEDFAIIETDEELQTELTEEAEDRVATGQIEQLEEQGFETPIPQEARSEVRSLEFIRTPADRANLSEALGESGASVGLGEIDEDPAAIIRELDPDVVERFESALPFDREDIEEAQQAIREAERLREEDPSEFVEEFGTQEQLESVARIEQNVAQSFERGRAVSRQERQFREEVGEELGVRADRIAVERTGGSFEIEGFFGEAEEELQRRVALSNRPNAQTPDNFFFESVEDARTQAAAQSDEFDVSDIAVEFEGGEFQTRPTESAVEEFRRERGAEQFEEQFGVDVRPEEVRIAERDGEPTPVLTESGEEAVSQRLTETGGAFDFEERLERRVGQGGGTFAAAMAPPSAEATGVGPGDVDLEPGEDFRVTVEDGQVRTQFTEEFREEELPAIATAAIEEATAGRRVEIQRTRAAAGTGFAQAGADITGGEAARRQIRSQLEEDVGVDLEAEDVTFEEEDGQVTGRLTPEARREIQVQQQPIVQLTQGTPFEGIVEEGAEFGVRQAEARRRRREDVFGEIGQREEAEAFIEDVGLSEERERFESLQTEAQARLGDVRSGVGDVADRAEAAAAITVGAPVAAGLEATDTPTEVIEDIPSPQEDPEAFAAVATPIAVGEPTPVGEFVVAAALVGGGALAASEAGLFDQESRVDRTLQAEATAEVPGMFPPEQRLPEQRGLFVSEQEVEPPSLDLPELLAPTSPRSQISRGRLTPPELETPSEPASDPFAAEIEQPQEAIGRGFFSGELEIPALETGGALQQVRQTRQTVQRERRRRLGQTVPDEFIPDEPATIGGGTGAGIGEAGEGVSGEGVGPRFIFRPDPRSMELRRIETEEGGFRIGPEFTRFLGAQTLDAETGPELGQQMRTRELPAPDTVGGEFAAAASRQQARQFERDALAMDTLSDLRPDTDVGVTPATAQEPATDTMVDQQQRQSQLSETVQTTATTTPGLGEETVTEPGDVFEETTQYPTETVTEQRPRPRPRFDFDMEPLESDEDEFTDEDFEKQFEADVAEPLNVLEDDVGVE